MKLQISYRKPILLLTLYIFTIKCTEQPQAKIEFDFEKEKAAIRKVIAMETESYYKQDFDSWKNTYLQSPAFRKFGYWEGYPEKIVCINGFESLAFEKKKQFESNETL